MAPKKTAKKKPRSKKRPIRRVAAARKTLRQAQAHATAAGATSPGREVAQLPLPHVPPPLPRKHTAEQLAAVTVQTIRAGRLRADRWQAAAAAERRPWAVWAAMQLDAAADRAGLPALPQGAR